MSKDSPSALVFYHYLYPDKVVSSIHLSDLCAGLASRGWKVTAVACNRSCRNDNEIYPRRTTWEGVEFLRVWRPAFRQASSTGRMANSVWMTIAWSAMALNPFRHVDVLVIGTDPVLSAVAARFWRLFRPGVRIAHWCFDLYPEAAVTSGMSSADSLVVRLAKRLMSVAYASCDLIVDIGACMRCLLAAYQSPAKVETITPWALVETPSPAPVDSEERIRLFGESRLALLYSGTFGRAHSWTGIPELAKAIAGFGSIVFSVQGNRVEALKEAVKESGAPIPFAPFASEDRLQARLSAADVHIVTLHEGWTGTVVPSKFFGALAMGRPVLFVGRADSAIALWIEQFGLGWVLSANNFDSVFRDLRRLAECSETKRQLFERCHKAYIQHFSKHEALDRWDRSLRAIL
ncbi:MAG TPA: glycosyltransferase family 4 protein [Bryobacteraceae bacterium]|nr:glycosyltransferase family 4 protein [Bryobacteraceae bacterium]